MCGRFIDPNLRGTEFESTELKVTPFPRRFNVKPTDEIYVLFGDEITCARWGLIPGWHKDDLKDWRASTINARIEDAAKKPTFRGPWKYGRCLVPATGGTVSAYSTITIKWPETPRLPASSRAPT